VSTNAIAIAERAKTIKRAIKKIISELIHKNSNNFIRSNRKKLKYCYIIILEN
jgi:hypothetical protein